MNDFKDGFNNLNNTPDETGNYDPRDTEDNKFMGILAYLSWLVLIPIFAAKESRFARFHANQGLVLAIFELIIWIGISILCHIPLLGWLFRIIRALISLAFLVMSVIGIVNVMNGKAKELPFTGRFRILK